LLYTILVEVTEEGDLVGRCLDLPKAISNGKTLQELRRNMAGVLSFIQGSIYEGTAAKTEDKYTMEIEANM
jgi:predicted RNase H-like HicB family nuclease